jgi:hypothetical protein
MEGKADVAAGKYGLKTVGAQAETLISLEVSPSQGLWLSTIALDELKLPTSNFLIEPADHQQGIKFSLPEVPLRMP